jgi:hypothetical protein
VSCANASVSDPGGVHDLYFVADWAGDTPPELFVRALQFQTTPVLTATVNPATPKVPAAGTWETSL